MAFHCRILAYFVEISVTLPNFSPSIHQHEKDCLTLLTYRFFAGRLS
jgi:hypothetical protein